MSINSSGLPNYGYNFYTNMGKELREMYNSRKYRYLYEAKKPYIMSVSGMTLEDNIKILTSVFSKSKECSIELVLN